MTSKTQLLLLASALASLSCGSQKVALKDVTAAVYARQDNNDTRVWAPRTHARLEFGDSAGADVAYTLDAWTGASVDVVTAATQAIHEIRHEINAGTYYEFSNVTVQASYRYSREPDYWSHGGVLGLRADLASNNTTLGLDVIGGLDTVGRAGDPWFQKPLDSVGGKVSYTQVLDRNTVLQVAWETVYLQGFQSSPYRFVALAEPDDVSNTGPSGLCATPSPTGTSLVEGEVLVGATRAQLCLPELHPDRRLRQAGSVRARRALGPHVSLGAGYRFYFDDWGVQSHTLTPSISFLVGDAGTLALDYRFYTQGSADFYQSSYVIGVDDIQYYTRDRKLSPMMTNRVGFEYAHGFDVGSKGNRRLLPALRTGYTRFTYRDFVGLESVDALEVTASFGIALQ